MSTAKEEFERISAKADAVADQMSKDFMERIKDKIDYDLLSGVDRALIEDEVKCLISGIWMSGYDAGEVDAKNPRATCCHRKQFKVNHCASSKKNSLN